MFNTISENNLRAMQLLVQRSHRLTAEGRAEELQRMEHAWREGRLAFSARDPRYYWALCVARGMLGDYSDWRGWEFRSPWAARVRRDNPFAFPLWDGRPTGRLLLVGEQGVGDEVLYASCVPDVLAVCGAQSVMIETDARLVPAFTRSFGTAVEASVWQGEGAAAVRTINRERGDASAWLPMADLLPLFRHSAADFPGTPYLRADPRRVAEFERYRGWTGVSWRGNNGHFPWRTFDGHRVLSLQYDQRPDEDIPAPDIDLKNDIEGVLALVSVLGRVISVSTAVAHFACAMGAETHVVLAPAESSGVPDDRLNWRWGLGSRVPWYRSARVYQTLGEWCHSDVAQRLWSAD